MKRRGDKKEGYEKLQKRKLKCTDPEQVPDI
jgi:hypothetical protein